MASYRWIHEYDQASSDFNHAISLILKYSIAYAQRGIVSKHKGNRFRALGWFVGDGEKVAAFLRRSEGREWHIAAFAAPHHFGS